ncbi:LysR substrate-binding domain-containing protein [Roseovarius sp.]|uniref:LysR substrate-binding domain-containing protein n=1 Tax=Roseovarius sp. TaxID=1486281 RepID=UPI003D0CEA52
MPVAPPRPKGPPLNALRAFEAAARLGGFALAAEELCVTPGAVSQHIKTVEDWAGTPLFERRSHGVRLTKAGAGLLPEFSAAFDQLGHATRALRGVVPSKVVQVAALPSVAQLWLAPRLARLRRVRPGTRISVTALETPPNLSRDMFDLSLFIASPDSAQAQHMLARDEIFPVCAPDLAQEIETPDDLADQTLLVDAAWPDDWSLWASRAGVTLQNQSGSASFSLYAMAVEEARAGAGVLMAHRVLVQAALDAGDLVCPFDITVDTGKALLLTTAPGADDLARALVETG